MRFHRRLDRSSHLLYAAHVGNFALQEITLTIIGASVPQVIRAFGWNAVYTAAGVLAAASSTGDARTPPPGDLRVFFEPVLLLSFCIILLYAGSELGISNWIAEYFVKEHGSTPSKAAYMSSALWAGILAGRIFLSALPKGSQPDDPRQHGARRESLLMSCAFGRRLRRF
jgi:hypothetical protein